MAPRLKLAIIGDPHLAIPQGPEDNRIEIDRGLKLHGQSKILLEAALAAVNAESDIDAVLLLGDMTRDSELFNNQAAADLLAAVRVPFYILAGNHDYAKPRRDDVSYPDVVRLDRAEFVDFWHGRGLPQRSGDYKVELPGGVDLIALDTNATMAEFVELGWPPEFIDYGYVSPAQLAWLDAQLTETRAQGRVPLVAAHHTLLEQSPAERPGHPMASIFGFWQVRDGDALREVLHKHRVPLVVSGHLHIQSVNEQDGLTNLACAALVSYPHSWGVLTVEDGASSYESRSLAPLLPPGFIADSRAMAIEGIKELIQRELAVHPLLGAHSAGIAEMVARSEWWPRLCDGTLAGFAVDEGLLPGDPLLRMIYAEVAKILNEYGIWKAQRGDPNKVVVEPT